MRRKPRASARGGSQEITVGTIPFHGIYRIVAEGADGTEMGEITIEFNCFPEGAV